MENYLSFIQQKSGSVHVKPVLAENSDDAKSIVNDWIKVRRKGETLLRVVCTLTRDNILSEDHNFPTIP